MKCPLGSKLDISECPSDVRFTPKADIAERVLDVRFVPKACIVAYSISSSARESTELGTVRPSALAVLRLITKSNLVEA